MSRTSIRTIAAIAVLALASGGCANSKSDGTSGPVTTSAEAPDPGTGGEQTRDVKKDISGVPGVTGDEISYTAVGTKEGNPLGTCILDCYVDGIEAYFAYRNSEGGIYGRKLVLNDPVDDELANNQARALDITTSKEAFGDFQATLVATGWGDLDSAGIPTYAWGINATEAANRQHIFSSLAVQCTNCTAHAYSYLAKQAGATKAATIGYGVSENSKQCVGAIEASYKLFAEDSGVTGVYANDSLAFGLPNGIGPEVTAMKQRRAQVRRHRPRPQRHDDLGPGARPSWDVRRGSHAPQHLQPGLRGREQGPLRGRLRGPPVLAVRGVRPGDCPGGVQEVDGSAGQPGDRVGHDGMGQRDHGL